MPILQAKGGSLNKCRCGLNFKTRKEYLEHIKNTHNAGKRPRITKRLGADGKRMPIKPEDDRF